MLIRFFPPHPLLREIVSNIMICTHSFDRAQPPSWNLFPAIPEHSLYFYPRDSITVHHTANDNTFTCPPSTIIGPQVERVNVSMGYDHIVIRVGFHAGGLYRLLHLPLHEIVDFTCNSEDFFGRDIRCVTEQLRNTDDLAAMKDIVEDFLLQRLSRLKPVDRLDLTLAALSRGGIISSVDALSRDACFSPRQLERKCKERIGLSPKLFARIVRFSRAYRMREAQPSASWTSIAHAAGYYDQMHLIRDFKVFAGVTPSVLDKELAAAPALLQSMLKI